MSTCNPGDSLPNQNSNWVRVSTCGNKKDACELWCPPARVSLNWVFAKRILNLNKKAKKYLVFRIDDLKCAEIQLNPNENFFLPEAGTNCYGRCGMINRGVGVRVGWGMWVSGRVVGMEWIKT